MEAIQLDPKNKFAHAEKTLLDRLKDSQRKENRLKPCQELKVVNDYKRSEAQPYNILSISGGGVRGVLPAMILCEIEKATKVPICQLFNMHAGTSTGAVIAAGLSVPKPNSRTPQYCAHDLLNLYRTEAELIFTDKKGSIRSLLGGATYSDRGRNAQFQKYFKKLRLSDALNDLMIPAVEENDLQQSYFFNTFEARASPSKDELLYNVLMATTASPTFFNCFKIPERGIFHDGGLHLNNPSEAAYTTALRQGIPRDKIFVLSLGTGSCISDPYDPDKSRGVLFWAKNLGGIVLPAQEGNTDIAMHGHLGSKYYSMQVCLEDPILLDAYNKIDTLIEIGHNYIEELYAADDNRFAKLIEYLQEK